MKHFYKALAIAIPILFTLPCFSKVKHVILISIDGFHPDMYLDKSWPCPNLRYLMKNGTYADYMKGVFPSFTYPSHTAMVTGALPARSKILYNQPIGSQGEWYWYANSIKVPTLWQAAHQNHLTTAAVMWPVTVRADIDYNISELWDISHPEDRITVARKYTNPTGLTEELERNATGKLDASNMDESHFSMDDNCGRMAAYLIQKYKPNFLALHLISADENEHDYGRDADSVRLAMESNDRIIGNVLESIDKAGIKDSTAVIIVGDHGFATIHTVMRPNMLIKGIPAKFVASGGSCFLYRYPATTKNEIPGIVKAFTDSLDKLPKDKRELLRIVYRKELDQMGADSNAVLALTAEPGMVFSASTTSSKTINHGAGTLIQQSLLEGVFYPTHGGHHGYDPNIPEMYTGFIAAGADIVKGGHIQSLSEPDIAVLIAKLLGINFPTPDGHLTSGIIQNN